MNDTELSPLKQEILNLSELNAETTEADCNAVIVNSLKIAMAHYQDNNFDVTQILRGVHAIATLKISQTLAEPAVIELQKAADFFYRNNEDRLYDLCFSFAKGIHGYVFGRDRAGERILDRYLTKEEREAKRLIFKALNGRSPGS